MIWEGQSKWPRRLLKHLSHIHTRAPSWTLQLSSWNVGILVLCSVYTWGTKAKPLSLTNNCRSSICTVHCTVTDCTSLLMVDVTNFSHSEGIFNMYSVLQNLGVSKICILLKNHQESLYKIKNIITFETIIHVFHSGNRSVLQTKSLIRTDICTSLNKYRLLSQIYMCQNFSHP